MLRQDGKTSKHRWPMSTSKSASNIYSCSPETTIFHRSSPMANLLAPPIDDWLSNNSSVTHRSSNTMRPSSAGILTGDSPATEVKMGPIHSLPTPFETANPRWFAPVLRSMTDLSRLGEADDSHMLPALDSWLGTTYSPDVCDSHGSTLLMVASCFGKVPQCLYA